MKKILFLILITLLFSCKKEKSVCWTCIDSYHPSVSMVICDPVEASYQNSKKHYKDISGIWHDWNCNPK